MPNRNRKYTDDEFIEAVKASRSWNQVFKKLGLKVGGGQYPLFKKRAKELGVDYSHMKGQGWADSKTMDKIRVKTPIKNILVENYEGGITTNHLKKRLWKEGLLDKKCYNCGITEWLGKPAPLQLDHINGKRIDNRIENLRILCPNCHATTDTYCGKNKG